MDNIRKQLIADLLLEKFKRIDFLTSTDVKEYIQTYDELTADKEDEQEQKDDSILDTKVKDALHEMDAQYAINALDGLADRGIYSMRDIYDKMTRRKMKAVPYIGAKFVSYIWEWFDKYGYQFN